MKVIERMESTQLGGGGPVTTKLIRVIEVEGKQLAEGQTKAPDDAELHDWKPEEAN